MSRWTVLVALLLAMVLPLNAQTSKSKYLAAADHMCNATLADGTPYQAWGRIFVTKWKEHPLYVKVRAYYRPGSGELLWSSTGLSEKGYASEMEDKTRAPCEESNDHLLILQGGEWVDFWAQGGRVTIFHCNLRFETREKAWSYIAEHWQDAKWVEEIVLYPQLGNKFFRPAELEFASRAYSYNSLVSAKKVGTYWDLELKGADEPNRATVLLDNNFKLIAVKKH